MLNVMVLGSGSAGNAVVVTTPDTRLLIDAGLSAKQLDLRLREASIDPASLEGILLTHEHGDHTRGLEVFCRQCPVPVYCNRQTQRLVAENLKRQPAWRLIEAGAVFQIGGLHVEAFSVPHDAVDPMGFTLAWQGARLGVLTDLGHPTTLVMEKARGVHTLVIEANYDDAMLAGDTKRPWATKQRISSRHGHLSNAQAAEIIRQLVPHGLRRVVLAHLSRDCNSPDTAIRCLREAANGSHLEIHCAEQDRSTGLFEVVPGGAGSKEVACAKALVDESEPGQI